MPDLLQPARRLLADLAYRRQAGDVFGHWRWLAAADRWPAERRARWRLERLNALLEHCWRRVPFYREFWGDHGLAPGPLADPADLARFPVLTKDLVRAHGDGLRPADLARIRHHRKSTGGTTGQPLQYRQDLDHWAFTQGFHYWGWSLMGYRFGDPVAVLAGGSLIPDDPGWRDRLRAWLENRTFCSGVHMDRDLARRHAAAMVRAGARYLYGYPSAIALFGRQVRDQGLARPALLGIVTTAETLSPHDRATIEDTLAAPVFDHLGCNDGGYMAYECPRHEGLHYNDLQAILQTAGPAGPAGDDSAGELLITNLWNRSQPFVRYANGDRVALADAPCPCGRGFPLIARIEGRTLDVLHFPDGRSLAGPALTLIFRGMDLDGWQVVQTAPAALDVRLAGAELRPEWERHVRRVLAEHVGAGVQVTVRRVDRLERTAAGKLRPVWSEVGRDPAAGQ